MYLCLYKMCFFVIWKYIFVKFFNIFKIIDIFFIFWLGVSFENKNKKVLKMGKMILLIIFFYWYVVGFVYYIIYWNFVYKNIFGIRERWLFIGNKKFYYFFVVRIMLILINLWSNKIKFDNELLEIYCL